jgi:hypothetical protein
MLNIICGPTADWKHQLGNTGIEQLKEQTKSLSAGIHSQVQGTTDRCNINSATHHRLRAVCRHRTVSPKNVPATSFFLQAKLMVWLWTPCSLGTQLTPYTLLYFCFIALFFLPPFQCHSMKCPSVVESSQQLVFSTFIRCPQMKLAFIYRRIISNWGLVWSVNWRNRRK